MKILLHRTDVGRKRNGPVSAYQIVYKEAKLVYLFQRVQNSIPSIRKSFYAKFSIERFERKCFNLCPSICPINCPIYFASAWTECPYPDNTTVFLIISFQSAGGTFSMILSVYKIPNNHLLESLMISKIIKMLSI